MKTAAIWTMRNARWPPRLHGAESTGRARCGARQRQAEPAAPAPPPGSAGIFKANTDLQAVLKQAIAEDQRHGRARRSPSPISTG